MCKVFVRQNWTKFKQIENFLTRAQHLSVHGVQLESKEKKVTKTIKQLMRRLNYLETLFVCHKTEIALSCYELF